MKKKLTMPQNLSIPVYYHINENGKIILDIDQMKDFFVQKMHELENYTHSAEEIYDFEDWLNYMLVNSDYDTFEILEFEDHYQNLLNFQENTNLFLNFKSN